MFVGMGANSPSGYNITDSLRFRSSASASLTRTPASAGNRQRWTFSTWIKRGALGSLQVLFSADASANTETADFSAYFASSDALEIGYGAANWKSTTQLFRDPSAWYHIVIAFDTTLATGTDRIKLYVNGSQVTSFSTNTAPTLNLNGAVNNTVGHSIGRRNNGTYYSDNYQTEINFVDGQALTASDFGEYNTDGVWVAKEYTGTYGTNGFYLPFNYEPTYTHDIFGDSSAKATYMLDANANDLGGSYNGTANNLTYTAGKFGQAGLFNGSTSTVILPNNTLGATSAHSISFWFKISATGLFRYMIANRNATKTYSIAISATNKVVFGDWQGSGSNLTGTDTVTDGNWHHLVYINNSGSITGYIDGVQDSALTGTHNNVAQSLTNGVQIGNWDYDNSSSFSGSIDQVRAFNRALTSSEVTTLYNETEYSGFTADQSGNGNHWQSNNVSTVAGATYDLMSDTPSLADEDTGNFATLNPLDHYSINVDFSDANLKHTVPAGSYTNGGVATSTITMTSGKWYCEMTALSAYSMMGIAKLPRANMRYLGDDVTGYGYYTNGSKYNNAVATAYGATFTTNDVIGVALDLDAGTLTFYKNGVSQGTAFTGLSGEFVFATGNTNPSNAVITAVNFGQRPFAYTPPTGFKKLNTFNLPDSSITDGSQHFDVSTWTGNGGTQDITLNFSPDLVWAKDRSAVSIHMLSNTISGPLKSLSSNDTTAEASNDAIRSFNTNGFTTGTWVNTSSNAFVGWSWRGSDSTAVSNTDGTITSTVSANTTSGFSVVTYTGNGTSGATVGHGLGNGITGSKGMIIIKRKDAATNWAVYHPKTTNANWYLQLNTTSAQIGDATVFNNNPTAGTIVLGTNSIVNASGGSYVAYCFAEVEGFSKFGSYTGNGSTDGPFVYTGFRPAFVMIKRTSGINSWNIMDNSREGYNPQNDLLFPDTSNAESNVTDQDILSNGFKLRTTGSGRNGNGETYIYMAFAENPFKNSLAR